MVITRFSWYATKQGYNCSIMLLHSNMCSIHMHVKTYMGNLLMSIYNIRLLKLSLHFLLSNLTALMASYQQRSSTISSSWCLFTLPFFLLYVPDVVWHQPMFVYLFSTAVCLHIGDIQKLFFSDTCEVSQQKFLQKHSQQHLFSCFESVLGASRVAHLNCTTTGTLFHLGYYYQKIKSR